MSADATTKLDSEPALFRDTRNQDRVLRPQGVWVRHRRAIIFAALTCLGLAALVVTLLQVRGADDSVSRSQLTFSVVQRGTFVRDLAADGKVIAANSPTMYAAAAGKITLKTQSGDAVNEGDVLAVIDSPDLFAQLSQEEALLRSLIVESDRTRINAKRKLAQMREAYNAAEVDERTADREFDRSRKAFQVGAYSELQHLRAQDALEKAQAAAQNAKADFDAQGEENRFEVASKEALVQRQKYVVEELRRQKDALQVRSPVAGRVGQVLIADRANVPKDAPLLSVIDLSALEVEINVPQGLARDLNPGMPADLEGNNQHWKGVVSAISPQVVGGQVAARLRFGEEQPDGLRQNQRLLVRIFIDKRENALIVDRGGFLEQEGGFAYVVQDNVAERRPVRFGAASVQKVEILSGLAENDEIVVSGTESFHGASRIILSR